MDMVTIAMCPACDAVVFLCSVEHMGGSEACDLSDLVSDGFVEADVKFTEGLRHAIRRCKCSEATRREAGPEFAKRKAEESMAKAKAVTS